MKYQEEWCQSATKFDPGVDYYLLLAQSGYDCARIAQFATYVRIPMLKEVVSFASLRNLIAWNWIGMIDDFLALSKVHRMNLVAADRALELPFAQQHALLGMTADGSFFGYAPPGILCYERIFPVSPLEEMNGVASGKACFFDQVTITRPVATESSLFTTAMNTSHLRYLLWKPPGRAMEFIGDVQGLGERRRLAYRGSIEKFRECEKSSDKKAVAA